MSLEQARERCLDDLRKPFQLCHFGGDLFCRAGGLRGVIPGQRHGLGTGSVSARQLEVSISHLAQG